MLGRAFEEAVVYATIVHGDQSRKRADSGRGPRVPYMAHLLGVASLTLEDGGSEEEAVAALLHDAVEDRGGLPRYHDIRLRFGDRVARIVRGCSDAAPEAGAKKLDWWERKRAYVKHLDQLDPDVEGSILRVSMSDKLYNLRATVRDARPVEGRQEFWELFKTGAAGQLWYYRALVSIYRTRCSASVLFPELEALARELGRLVSTEDRERAAAYAGRQAKRKR